MSKMPRTKNTIDGFTYFEPEEAMTYDEAMVWASTHGLRLLTRGEWCDLYDNKQEFRDSCENELYWTASPHFNKEDFSWYFLGTHGIINHDSKKFSCVVRAIKEEPEVLVNTENKRNLIDEVSILTMENEILRNNNKELGQQRHALMEEVAELRLVLSKIRHQLIESLDDSYIRLNKVNGLTATNDHD